MGENDGGYIITSEESEDEKLIDLSKCSENFEKLLFQSAHRIYEKRYLSFCAYMGNSRKEYEMKLKELEDDDIYDGVRTNFVTNGGLYSPNWNVLGNITNAEELVKNRYTYNGEQLLLR